MMEPAFFNQGNTPAPADAGYKSWQSAGRRAVMRHDVNDRTAGPMPSFGTMVHETALVAQGAHAYAPQGSNGNTESATKPDIAYETKSKDDEYSFDDVIDIINPLQHLPVINMIYRKLTGDTIKPISNIIGGAIFGGPVGAVSSTINAIVQNRTGKDIAENAFSMVGINLSPDRTAPEIMYDDVNASSLSYNSANEDYATAANLYEKTSDGRHNFAAKTASSYSWNA